MRIVSLIFLLLTLSFGKTNAQFRVTIQDMSDLKLAVGIEKELESLLTQLYKAYSEQKPINFNEIKFKKSGMKQLETIWGTSPFYPIEQQNIVRAAKRSDDLYEIRSIPVGIEASGKIEELIFVCTEKGELADIKLAIELHKFDILSKGDDVTDTQTRETILGFLETYRTAYMNKDLDFVKKVFSDQALIIIGKEIKTKKADGSFNKQVEYLKLTKVEYLNRLKTIFKQNNWIDIQFSKITLVQHHNISGIYGVNLTQRYQSTIYSDEGYLFLLMDFRKPDLPIIHVRAWQPTNTIEEANAFSLGDLEIY